MQICKLQINKRENHLHQLSIIFICLFAYWIICLFLPKKVFADISLGVYPPIIQIDATPPTSIKEPLFLQNLSDSPVTVTLSFRPFTQTDAQNGQVRYLSPSDVFGADAHIFQKIQVLDEDNQPRTSIDLAPQQQKTLTLHIGLPKDEPPSDYYFSIVYTSNPSAGSGQVAEQSGSGMQAGVATNVLLSIGPKSKTTGFLEEYSAPWFVQTAPIPFTVKVNNLSNHFVNPRGQILIRNMFGQLVGKVDLLPVNVLGGTSRYIPGNTTSSGLTKAIWDERFLLGVYRANIVISLSPEGPIFTKAIYFVAMPFSYMIGIGIAILLITMIIVRVTKRLSANESH